MLSIIFLVFILTSQIHSQLVHQLSVELWLQQRNRQSEGCCAAPDPQWPTRGDRLASHYRAQSCVSVWVEQSVTSRVKPQSSNRTLKTASLCVTRFGKQLPRRKREGSTWGLFTVATTVTWSSLQSIFMSAMWPATQHKFPSTHVEL